MFDACVGSSYTDGLSDNVEGCNPCHAYTCRECKNHPYADTRSRAHTNTHRPEPPIVKGHKPRKLSEKREWTKEDWAAKIGMDF